MSSAVLAKVRAAGRRNTAIFAKCWRTGVDPVAHQYDMAKRIDSVSQYQADFWPRDHGKSEIFCLSYPLRRICEDPNIRILIVQKTATEAEKTLQVIKTELETNHELKAHYAGHWQKTVGHRDISNEVGSVAMGGGKREGAWQQRRIYVKRTRRGKDPTVEAVGVGGAITGGHFDIIILDDIEDDENTKTDERLSSMINWFTGTIMQLREPDTKMIVVGTLKTNKPDIYSLVQESPVWDTYVTGAILSHDIADIEHEPVYNDEGTVVGVDVQTPDVKTLWPQKWDIATLLLEKLASLDQAVWIREKLNDLKALEGKVFKREKFGYFDDEDLRRIEASLNDETGEGGGFVNIIQAWDTAFKETETADWSVCVTLGLYKGKAYVLDVLRRKMEMPALKSAIVNQFLLWRPSRVCIEDKASGTSAIQLLEAETGIPIHRVSPEGLDKVARARGVTVYVENGRVLLRQGADWVQPFISELGMFPDDKHDDQVDALVYGLLELMLNSGSGIYV